MTEALNNSGPGRLPPRFLARRRLKRWMPLLVWSAVFLVTASLYVRQGQSTLVTGFAEERRFSVASETAGRLQRLEVELNQDVREGQIVASFADEDLRLQLAEARTELNRLAGELDREKALWALNAAGQQVDQLTNLRRFSRDFDSAQVDYLDALANLAEDRITLQGMELTYERTRRLQESELTSLASLDADRIAYQALAERVAQQEPKVEILLAASRDSEARYRRYLAEFKMPSLESGLILKPFEFAIKIQETRIERINLAITRLVLRAPADGVVVAIFRRAGEVAAAGQTVVSILDPSATTVVAYVPEHEILDYQPGAPVKVRRVADPRQVFSTTIASLGANIEQLPARLEPGAVVPSWGLPVLISLPDSLTAIPGETFELIF